MVQASLFLEEGASMGVACAFAHSATDREDTKERGATARSEPCTQYQTCVAFNSASKSVQHAVSRLRIRNLSDCSDARHTDTHFFSYRARENAFQINSQELEHRIRIDQLI